MKQEISLFGRFMRMLARKGWIKLHAIDQHEGKGIVYCPLCLTDIKVCCPTTHVVRCPNCEVDLH